MFLSLLKSSTILEYYLMFGRQIKNFWEKIEFNPTFALGNELDIQLKFKIHTFLIIRFHFIQVA